MIIRIGRDDWLSALASVQPVLRARDAYSPRRHNASLAKNAARRIYFVRERKSPLAYSFTRLRAIQADSLATRETTTLVSLKKTTEIA